MSKFLTSLNLFKYYDILHREEIDMSVLKKMSDGDLEKMTIPLGARYKILQALHKRPGKDHTFITGIKVGDKIGAGAFGDVRQGTYNNTNVALKQLKSMDHLNDITAEADLLTTLRHPNIVSFFGLFNSEDQEQYMVMELMQGSVKHYLVNTTEKLRTADLVSMACQAAAGMVYLSEQKIVHRDLAARNLLIRIESEIVVKITDFGMSRHFDTSYYASSGSMVPAKWTAPEALKHAKFTSASDVWAFGVTLWEIFSGGQEPYPGQSNAEVVEKVLAGKEYELKPENCDKDIASLMRQCWAHEASNRPTFIQILAILTEKRDHCQRASYREDSVQYSHGSVLDLSTEAKDEGQHESNYQTELAKEDKITWSAKNRARYSHTPRNIQHLSHQSTSDADGKSEDMYIL
eukprot:TRINITY_DN1599_c0_g1_i2.p1 TRINITY_DN1599_c0_g1~~TRINITY_DN1599_c0_g1_i2.p1  ORF type:complete len:405 (-),score=104.66 TRINITY_DN1599_c0_g1_i2:15-1229(-)